MDLSYSESEEQFRRELVTWLEENKPSRWGDQGYSEENYTNMLVEWQKKLVEGKWNGISWPKKYGGRGATFMEEIIFEMEMAKVKAPRMLNLVGVKMVGPLLIQIGTEEQKKKYLHNIKNGEEVWCQGYSEPNAGSDLAALSTRAVKNGNQWIIHGQKTWSSNAHLADRCFLLARTSKEGKKHEGITAFLVDMKQAEIEVRPIEQMTDHEGFNEIFFNGALVDESDIVGEVNNGWKVAMTLLGLERSGIAGRVFALHEHYLELLELAKRQSRGGSPLTEDPLVRQKLAQYYVKTKACLYTYLRHVSKRIKTGKAGSESSIDKVNYSELYKELMGYMMHLHGPFATLWKEDAYINHDLQDRYLTTFGWTLSGGTSEIQKNIIAERILGLPREKRN